MADDTARDAAADELYAAPPADFVAARDEQVRSLRASGDAAGARAVAKLRRPTAAAWLVNLLVRDQRDVVDQLLGLGAALREAQDALDGPTLRTLSAQRRAVVDALVRDAARGASAAGAPVTAEVRGQVQATLEAALLDADVAVAVRAGRLERPVERAAFALSAGDPQLPREPVRAASRAAPDRPAAKGPAGSRRAAGDTARDRAAGRTSRDRAGADPAAAKRAAEERAARRRVEEQAARQQEAEATLAAARKAYEDAAVEVARTGEALAKHDRRVEELRAALDDAQRQGAERSLDARRAQAAVGRAEAAVTKRERELARISRRRP